jgi:hypothetical protein
VLKIDDRPSLCESLREALRFHCWEYVHSCLPEQRQGQTRASLKQELAEAAKLAERLVATADRIWRSGDPAVHRLLADLARIEPPGDGLPVHPLRPGFVAFLDQFWRQTQLLATSLNDDSGGRRSTNAFSALVMALAGMYRQLTGEDPKASKRDPFFQFVAGVTKMLEAAGEQIPAAKLDLPPTSSALLERLRRLANADQSHNPARKMGWLCEGNR